MLSLSDGIQKPKNTQNGQISGTMVLRLGETVNSNVQTSYLKSLTKLETFIKVYNKIKMKLLFYFFRKMKFLKKKSTLAP